MHFRIRLPGGTLKLKTAHFLRRSELERKVPVRKIGWLYIIWQPSKKRNQRRMQ